jgi:hypothetical protein
MKNWLLALLFSTTLLVFSIESELIRTDVVIGLTLFIVLMAVSTYMKRARAGSRDVSDSQRTEGGTFPPSEKNIQDRLKQEATKAPAGSKEPKAKPPTKGKTKKPKSTKTRTEESTAMNEVISPKHKLLVLSINRSVTDGKAIYEAARYSWKLNIDRAREVDFVLAHQKGQVVGVFEVDEWLPAEDQSFADRFNSSDAGRWAFVGHVADSEVLLQYFNKSLPEGFVKRGASNPVRFLDSEIESSDTDQNSESDEVLKTNDNDSSHDLSTAEIENIHAHIDSDGDLSTDFEIDFSQLTLPDSASPLYAIANIRMEAQDTTNDDAEELRGEMVSENRVASFRSGYMRVPAHVACDVEVSGSVSVYGFTEVARTALELRVAEETIDIDEVADSVDLKECSFYFDEDGYLSVSVELATDRVAVAIRIVADEEESTGAAICSDGNGSLSDSLYNLEEGAIVNIQILVADEAIYTSEYNFSATATYDEPTEENTWAEVTQISGGGSHSYSICLDFGGLLPTLIETKDGDYLEDIDEIGAFRFDGFSELTEEFEELVRRSFDIEFDGDLDRPELFREIKLTALYGPSYTGYDDDGLNLSKVAVYMEVVATEEGLEEEDFEDIFHLIKPVVKIAGDSYYLGEFSEYSVVFEEPEEDALSLVGVWQNPMLASLKDSMSSGPSTVDIYANVDWFTTVDDVEDLGNLPSAIRDIAQQESFSDIDLQSVGQYIKCRFVSDNLFGWEDFISDENYGEFESLSTKLVGLDFSDRNLPAAKVEARIRVPLVPGISREDFETWIEDQGFDLFEAVIFYWDFADDEAFENLDLSQEEHLGMEAVVTDANSSESISLADFYEVCVPDEESGEWFYWVECGDEDEACEAALEKHKQLGRPEVLEDFDAGVFPGAYQPVIADNRSLAVVIRADELVVGSVDLDSIVMRTAEEFKLDPRNKVFAPQDLLIAAISEELDISTSPSAFREVLERYLEGEASSDDEEIVDAANYGCAQLARYCFSDDPDDDDLEVEYDVEWSVDEDGCTACIRPA